MDTEGILERRRLRRRATFWRAAAFLILLVAVLGAINWGTDLTGQTFPPSVARGHIADIRVDGFIETRPEAVELIDAAAAAGAVRAILLHIDSPGGAASGGEALYRAVRRASERKPVVAVIDGIGTSAAYMTAIGANYIVARETAITGSIGVIFQYGHVEELLDRLGVEYGEVKSSPMKAEPSPFKEPNPEALEMIRALVADTYDWFVGLVAERRGFSPSEARALSDGSIFTGRQALQRRLVDAVGGDAEARAFLAEAGVPADLSVRRWEEEGSVLDWVGAAAAGGLVRLLGLDQWPIPSGLLPRRLVVDGLLSVWQAPATSRSDG